MPFPLKLYDRLFNKERSEGDSPNNPAARELLTSSFVEPNLTAAKPGDRSQVERRGYFCVDLASKPDVLVSNPTVTPRDRWAKIEKKSQ